MIKCADLARMTAEDIRTKYGLKLTAPIAVWADEVIEKIALNYKDCAKKGTYKAFAKEIIKYFPQLSEEYVENICKKYERYR